MHDPMTQAFSIRRPWHDGHPIREKSGKAWKWYPPIVTIWHRDPERDGDENSCDWFYRHLTPVEDAAALELITNEVDNLCFYFKGWHRDDVEMVMRAQWREARRFYRNRPWYKHPRWHVWHWRFQVHDVLHFKRWMWGRCETCGGRFRYGEAPVSRGWNRGGPQWFRSEVGIHHMRCESQRHRARRESA